MKPSELGFIKRTPFRCEKCGNAVGKDHLTCMEINRPVPHYGWCRSYTATTGENATSGGRE